MYKRIVSFKIERRPDYDADLSYLGTFDNDPKDQFAVEHDPQNPRVLHWFNPQLGTCETEADAKRLYDRFMAYERGNWEMIDIKAIAAIQTSTDGKNWLLNTLTSGGLYGVESDMSDADMREVETEQAEDLVAVLEALGFTLEEIKNAQHKS